jgi:nucleolar pre-ribosomal-associated protein 1
VLSLFSTSQLHTSLKLKIVQLLISATEIEEGSTTLVTRTGVVAWLKVEMAHLSTLEDSLGHSLLDLALKLVQTVDRTRTDTWSSGLMTDMLLRLVEAGRVSKIQSE